MITKAGDYSGCLHPGLTLGSADIGVWFNDYARGNNGGSGIGGQFASNEGTNDAGNKDDCRGNPIVIATGNKIEPERDFGSGGEIPLSLSRSYNHYWAGVGLFGKHWLSNHDFRLTFGTHQVDACYPRPGGGACGIGAHNTIYAWRPDGRTIAFIRNAGDGIYYEDKPSPVARIVPMVDGSFDPHSEEGSREHYSAHGYVQSIRNRAGIGWQYSYSGTYPVRATHTSGRYIDFVWTSGQLTAVRDPAGQYYGYAYHANQLGSGLHRLAASSRPGIPASTTTYHYEVAFAGALTGKSINGQRYSTFQYDPEGRAIRS